MSETYLHDNPVEYLHVAQLVENSTPKVEPASVEAENFISWYFHVAQLAETSAFKFELEYVSVEVENFKTWFEEKVPAEHRLSEDLWDLPLVMWYKTHGDGPVNPVAETLLKLQSQTGEQVTPRGTAVFISKEDTISISQEMFDKLETSLAE